MSTGWNISLLQSIHCILSIRFYYVTEIAHNIIHVYIMHIEKLYLSFSKSMANMHLKTRHSSTPYTVGCITAVSEACYCFYHLFVRIAYWILNCLC